LELTVDTATMATAEPLGPHVLCNDLFAETLTQARAGSPSACRQLYLTTAGRVYGYLRARGAPEPEDITSEVFLRVFSHLDDFAGDENGFLAWVFTITRRLLIDEHRRDQRRPPAVELSAPLLESLEGGDTEADALGNIEHDDIDNVLAILTADQRDVIMLRIVADLSTEQVAQVLGKRRGTVKALQHRALATLRRHLTEAST
jgi:RNA polymerase sigma-70 factor (ECF subfamily)